MEITATHQVVDPETWVIGVEGLRVADRSIFPTCDQRQFEHAIYHDKTESGGSHIGLSTIGTVELRALD